MPPPQALGQEDLVDAAPLDRDALLLVEVGLQAVERPAAEGQAQVLRIGQAAAITSARGSALSVCGRPERGRFSRAGRPPSLNRRTQAETVGREMFNSRAMSAVDRPAAAARMILAHSTSRAGAVRPWATRSELTSLAGCQFAEEGAGCWHGAPPWR